MGSTGPIGGAVSSTVEVIASVMVGRTGPTRGTVGSNVGLGGGVRVGKGVKVGKGIGACSVPEGSATMIRLRTMLPTIVRLRTHKIFWLADCALPLRLLTSD